MKNEATHLEAAQLRVECLKMAVNIGISDVNRAIDYAKEFEAYAWGGFAPVIKPATPLSTIREAAQATATLLDEYIGNCANREKRGKVKDAEAQWTRFIADLTAALGDDYQ